MAQGGVGLDERQKLFSDMLGSLKSLLCLCAIATVQAEDGLLAVLTDICNAVQCCG